MFAYKITGNTSYEQVQITDSEVDNYQKPQWYVSDVPIEWSGPNAKRLNDNWELEGVPPIETPIPTPTVEGIRQQKIAEINTTYSAKLQQLSNSIPVAQANGKTTDTITARYTQTQEEWKTKLQEALAN